MPIDYALAAPSTAVSDESFDLVTMITVLAFVRQPESLSAKSRECSGPAAVWSLAISANGACGRPHGAFAAG